MPDHNYFHTICKPYSKVHTSSMPCCHNAASFGLSLLKLVTLAASWGRLSSFAGCLKQDVLYTM